LTDNEKLDFCLQNVSSDEITKLLNDGFSIDDICEAVKNVSQRTVESFNFFTISNLTDEEKIVVVNDVLDKIRAEIEEQVLESLSDGGDDWFAAEKVNECLDIIDKYKVESER